MRQYTHFSKDQLVIRLDNEDVIQTPEFVTKSPKNYRFDHAKLILEKKCIECNQYFEVQKYNGTEFYDIHNEEVLRFFSNKSGYEYRCNDCLEKTRNTEGNSKVQNQVYETSKGDGKFYLSKENFQYISHVAIIEEVEIEECLNAKLDIIRKNNKLTIKYEEKIS